MTTNKVVRRFAIILVALVCTILLLQFVVQQAKDYTALIPANTEGMIAAIEQSEAGQRAVVFKADGSRVEAPGAVTGKNDRDITWNPSGNRVFFVSDRRDDAFHVYRWNPSRNDEPEVRTEDRSGRAYPSFDFEKATSRDKADQFAIITARGIVQKLNPRDGTAQPLLPPKGKDVVVKSEGDDGPGSASNFDAFYKNIGSSFRIAKWMKGQTFVAAVMRRDEGEVLIVQPMEEDKNGMLSRPIILIAGQKIEITINPANGALVYSVLGFMYPNTEQIPKEMIKNGKVIKPFENVIGVFDPDSEADSGPIVASPDRKVAFINPSVAPDGSSVLVVVGEHDGDGTVASKGLVSFPVRPQSGQSGTPIKQGEIYDPSWHPNGEKIVYVRREGGIRSVFTAEKDGSSETKISDGKRNYLTPLFSPQSK